MDIILRKDDEAGQENKDTVLEVYINELPIWQIAVMEEMSCIFEVIIIILFYVQCTITKLNVILIEMQTLRHFDQKIITAPFDAENNTLGHVTAKSGNINLFKVSNNSLYTVLYLIATAYAKMNFVLKNTPSCGKDRHMQHYANS